MNRLIKLITSRKAKPSQTKLIIGLGNIGQEYAKTRHNAGFLAVDWLAGQLETDQWADHPKLNAKITRSNQSDILIAKPSTMMNLSGHSVAKIMHYYKISLDNLYVIHDDADLEIGEIKLVDNTQTGAGHHGVLSTIQQVGKGFKRIRIGIGRPVQPVRDISNYVLGRLSNQEVEILNQSFTKIKQFIS